MVDALGVPNLHFHDLRHTGNTLAADMGVSLRNQMARMGHDNERAALRYQHRSNNADRAIVDGFDALMAAERERDEDDGGAAGGRARSRNRPLIARRARKPRNDQGPVLGIMSLAWAFGVERVTGIEPALSAWE
ncbi:hypothetical protein ACFY4C_25050 [Actinomadura viridis]|uniref:hypothetical protein n=1 Tax=Actinomadura viridis TaxID=58110 RepID=UPI0036B2A0E9